MPINKETLLLVVDIFASAVGYFDLLPPHSQEQFLCYQ